MDIIEIKKLLFKLENILSKDERWINKQKLLSMQQIPIQYSMPIPMPTQYFIPIPNEQNYVNNDNEIVNEFTKDIINKIKSLKNKKSNIKCYNVDFSEIYTKLDFLNNSLTKLNNSLR